MRLGGRCLAPQIMMQRYLTHKGQSGRMIEGPGEDHGVLALLQAAIRVSEVPQGMRAEDATRHRWIVAAMRERKLPVPFRIVELRLADARMQFLPAVAQ